MQAQRISLANMQRRPLTTDEVQAAEKLRALWDRRAKGLNLTQEKAAHALGFKNQSAVSQYLNGRVPLSAKALAGLAQLLEVAPEEISKPLAEQWFLTSTVNMVRESQADYVTLEPGQDLPAYRRAPVVGMAQLGPDGYYDAIEYPVGDGDGHLDVPTADRNAYALRVRGDSMFPAIRDGWYVVVEPNRDHHPGDFVMVKTFDGRCMIKELLHERNGEIVLGNVNGNYGRLTLERDQVEKIALVGGIYPPSKYQPHRGA